MKIDDVSLSYPFIQYSVSVTHFTERKPTAMEWLILEVIKTASDKPKMYADVPFATLLEGIFNITDANLLILPRLLSLQDMQVIEADGLSDDTDLSQVSMRTLRLTRIGAEMQRTGRLPTTPGNDVFSIFYDPVKHQLLERADRTAYRDNFSGIPVIAEDAVLEADFPQGTIIHFLQQKQQAAARASQLSWLMSNTRIEHIEQAAAALRWKTAVKAFHMAPGFTCSAEGIDDPELNARILDSLALEAPSPAQPLPRANFEDPDADIQEIVPSDEQSAKIREFLRSADFCIVAQDIYSDSAFCQTHKKRHLRIAFLSGASEFHLELRTDTLVVSLPEQLLAPGTLFCSPSQTLCQAVFPLHVQEHSREAVFTYVPAAQPPLNVAETCAACTDRYSRQDPRILLVLYELGLKDLFTEKVKALASQQPSLAARAKLIETLNQSSKAVYCQNCLTPELLESLLLDPAAIRSACTSVDAAIAFLTECEGIRNFKLSDALYRNLLEQVLTTLPAPETSEELYRLWAHIRAFKGAHLIWVGQSGRYRPLYRETVIQKLLLSFDSDTFGEEHTPVEQVIGQLRRAYLRCQELLPELNFSAPLSEESIREAVLNDHREELPALREEFRLWNENLERFATRVGPVDHFTANAPAFAYAITVMQHLAESISIFFDDAALKYSRVCIVDTCALMNDPELPALFSDGMSMLIIPQVVLRELDGLKQSADEEKALAARRAIRSIESYSRADWFNLSEEGHPELLSPDLGDPQSSDNLILSVACRYIAKRPVLLTDDTNLRNKAASMHIDAIGGQSFRLSKEHEMSAQPDCRTKKKKKKR